MPTTPTATAPKSKPKTAKANYVYGRGRRRTATARVRVHLKSTEKPQITVNGLPVEQYFPGMIASKSYLEPLRTCNVIGKYYISVKVNGSGKNSQLAAFVHGLSRALTLIDPEWRPVLKKHGFLTRDPRTRERRKVGMGGKARRQKQSPKR